MADGPERTAAEREQARRERERRRTGRYPDEPLVGRDPEEPLVGRDPDEPLVFEDHRGFVKFDPGEDGARDDAELPSGTRRVSRMHRGPRTAQRVPAPQPGHRQPGSTKRHSRAGRVLAALALVVAGGAIWFGLELFQPFHGSGKGSVTVTIPPHSPSGQIGDLLAREGVISSAFFFELRATLAGERSDLRSGTYHLKRGMSYGDVLTILTTAPPAARVTDVTIVEGRTRRQIDVLLHSQGVRGSYLGATRRSSLLNPRRYGAPRGTPSLEGFLFPDTYQLREPIAIGTLVADQLTAFRQQFATINLGYARSKHLTAYDVLIVASMVEAEAQTARDRPLIASVIYNRLADGMPLQIDATTRYATGNYTSPLTVSELSSGSPYNTRIHPGLTPTPIDNPGLASLEAAAHPAHTNYLYFVVKPCGNGEQVFTSSYRQFLKYVQQYQTARSKRGGHSPAHC